MPTSVTYGSFSADAKSATAATAAPRIAIESVAPCVDGGRFPAKATLDHPVSIEADIFTDGHALITAALLWRHEHDTVWEQLPMRGGDNDRWYGSFLPRILGRHHFTIEAWIDIWGSYRSDLTKKRAAHRVERRDIADGIRLVWDAFRRTKSPALGVLSRDLDNASDEGAVALLLMESSSAAMKNVDERPFLVRFSPSLIVEADRRAAVFANWYELFPRSQAQDATAHGTFEDVISRLPSIRAMGFDVLYLPPIHPIGRTHRKGRNNSLQALPDDPGCPYAIGGREGGHDAVHPELGGIEGFRRLRAAAAEQRLELALDFAVQCSPDHPWLEQHPDWFSWRSDGSIRYAENPPKKYEDIVNVDFYAPASRPALWLELRNVLQQWIDEGVKIFRVDNPHTKPLPFWEWLIADIHSRHPDVIFLSEAFTRPAMMYRLAKIGFTQSYTYFTWRNSKREIVEYLTELTTTQIRDYFRPHFFVNTPDINPYFLQESGRGGFLIRAALAATLSGLWGMYSGFELCEAAAVPGKEEYLDSEKYQVKPRNWNAPGNIIDTISRLNQIRRENPALQSHLGLQFCTAFNDQVIYFKKETSDRTNIIFVAISLDPQRAQQTLFEVPLWDFGLPDDGCLEVDELMRGSRISWRGTTQHWYFDPTEFPFAIWRVNAPRGAAP